MNPGRARSDSLSGDTVPGGALRTRGREARSGLCLRGSIHGWRRRTASVVGRAFTAAPAGIGARGARHLHGVREMSGGLTECRRGAHTDRRRIGTAVAGCEASTTSTASIAGLRAQLRIASGRNRRTKVFLQESASARPRRRGVYATPMVANTYRSAHGQHGQRAASGFIRKPARFRAGAGAPRQPASAAVQPGRRCGDRRTSHDWCPGGHACARFFSAARQSADGRRNEARRYVEARQSRGCTGHPSAGGMADRQRTHKHRQREPARQLA